VFAVVNVVLLHLRIHCICVYIVVVVFNLVLYHNRNYINSSGILSATEYIGVIKIVYSSRLNTSTGVHRVPTLIVAMVIDPILRHIRGSRSGGITLSCLGSEPCHCS